MSETSENPSHSSYSDLIKGITDSAFILDVEKNVQDFNRSFVKLHDIDSKDAKRVKSSCCTSYVHLEICADNCILKKCLEVGATVRFDEVRGKSMLGEDLTLIVTAIPLKNQDGRITGVLEMHRNVTDEAKIHEKYTVLIEKEKRAKEELEKLVDARTAQLKKANEDLKKAESHLVHSEKMSSLGQMVAGIAHELNNPLNFISGNVDILEEYTDDLKGVFEKISSSVATSGLTPQELQKIYEAHDLEYKIGDLKSISSSIRKGSERATDVVQGLRTFSRLDEAQLKETDIHQDIDTTLMLLKNQYSGKINIHKEYGDVGPFKCFSSQLNQVYMNLLQNAIHALGDSGDIWIKTKLTDTHLIIQFVDNGTGMSEEVQKKIFDPFFTTKAIGEGTGLGLSVTYGIVQKHTGTIDVTSKLGEGTTFTISIPRKITIL